jgi:hypothetical protein
MSRTRMIRPEFWTSDQVVDCSRDARLTFLGVLGFCDDNGIHPASVRRLRMQIFPADPIADDDVAAWVNELIYVGLLWLYAVGEVEYLLVTGWNRHQKIDKPTYRHPLPDGQVGIRFSDELRLALVDSSPSSRRFLADASTRKQSKAKQGKAVFPSQDNDSVPTECVHGAAPKIPQRRFVAVAGGAE